MKIGPKAAMLFTILSGAMLFSEVAVAKGDGGLIYYSSGPQFIDMAPLNQSVQTGMSLPGEPSGFFWGNGVGVLGSFSQVIVGLEYHSLWGQILQKDQQALAIDGNYALLHLGYAAVATPQAQIFPYIGIGPGRVGLRSTTSLSNSIGLTQGDRNDVYAAEGLSWLFDLGAGANFIIPMSKGSIDKRGLALGLRGGYLWSLNATQWGTNQLPAQNGPAALNLGGWYLHATFGFGGFRS